MGTGGGKGGGGGWGGRLGGEGGGAGDGGGGDGGGGEGARTSPEIAFAVGALEMVTVTPAGANQLLCMDAVVVAWTVFATEVAADTLFATNTASTITPAEATVNDTSSTSLEKRVRRALRKPPALNDAISPAS